jgi:hypothetical protein
MLLWFDANADRYWWCACLVMAVSLFLLFRPMLSPRWQDIRGSDWWWSPLIGLLMCAGRWPTWLLSRQLNEDESLLIAGAITLRHDPMFFRSVNGGTAGPLDFYALIPSGWVNGADDFLSARITACVLITVALVFTHQSVAILFGRQTARIASLSATFLEAFTLNTELLHYSTELVAIALLAFAFWTGVRRFATDAHWLANSLGGIALGVIPFAKLQAAPIALFLGLSWICGELASTRGFSEKRFRLGALCSAAVLPLLAISLMIAAAGQWNTAFIPYILGNIDYVKAEGVGVPETAALLWRGSRSYGTLLTPWIVGCCPWILAGLALSGAQAKERRSVLLVIVGYLLASIVAIIAPQRVFLHYVQFIVAPLTLMFGAGIWAVAGLHRNQSGAIRCALLCSALVCSLGGVVYQRTSVITELTGSLSSFRSRLQGPIAMEILKYAGRGEALGVWGWMSRLYVETGMRQATRVATSVNEILPGRFKDYFRSRYLADFLQSSPPVFVDTVGRRDFQFKDRRLAHDQEFPALASFIKLNYTLVAELDHTRIYIRNDRLAQVP